MFPAYKIAAVMCTNMRNGREQDSIGKEQNQFPLSCYCYFTKNRASCILLKTGDLLFTNHGYLHDKHIDFSAQIYSSLILP